MTEKTERYTGTIIWFCARKGFGFIKQDHSDEDMFLHWSNIDVEGFKTVKPDQRVSYEIGENHHGAQSINVVLLPDQQDGE